MHTATLDGIVHGVVVHITNEMPSTIFVANTSFNFFKDCSFALNATSIDLEVLS